MDWSKGAKFGEWVLLAESFRMQCVRFSDSNGPKIAFFRFWSSKFQKISHVQFEPTHFKEASIRFWGHNIPSTFGKLIFYLPCISSVFRKKIIFFIFWVQSMLKTAVVARLKCCPQHYVYHLTLLRDQMHDGHFLRRVIAEARLVEWSAHHRWWRRSFK